MTLQQEQAQKEVDQAYREFLESNKLKTVSAILARESDEDERKTNATNNLQNNSNEVENPGLRAGLYGFFDMSEQLKADNARLRQEIQKNAQQGNEIELARAQITIMFMNSTDKLFANLVPQVWTQILQVHDEHGRAQQVSSEQNILPLLRQHFAKYQTTYSAYFAFIKRHTQSDSSSAVEKQQLDYVETQVYKSIVNVLNQIGFPAKNTVFDYSLTKAMTPFVLHMFVNGQHVPNICVAFILDMCITKPVQYAQRNQALLTDETAKQVVDVCLQYAYGAIITEEESQNLQKRYLEMYELFQQTYNNGMASLFSGFETHTWPIDGDVLKQYSVLVAADSGKMSDSLYFNDMQQLLLRF